VTVRKVQSCEVWAFIVLALGFTVANVSVEDILSVVASRQNNGENRPYRVMLVIAGMAETRVVKLCAEVQLIGSTVD